MVFAPDSKSGMRAQQLQFLDGLESEIEERDLVVLVVLEGQSSVLLGPHLNISGSDLMEHAGKNDDTFEVMLFGKDMGLKLSSRKPVTANEIFSLIDQMPMRRREIREQSN